MNTNDSLLAALRQCLGDNGVVTDGDLAPHLIDWRKRHTGQALCLLLPRTTAQVAEVLRLCRAQGLRVFPQGGNTSVCGGSVPAETGRNVILSLARMNRIVEVNARNNSMTVEAGCVLADIHTAAAAVDRLFPLSLGAEGSCQIGGNIATNAGGTNVVRFGNTRDLILGLEVVMPDGRIWNGLRTLRKNNSGYDLKNLFIGSEGTLGVVTAATLKLFPAPRSVATALLAFDNVDAAVDEAIRLQQRFPGEVVGLELMSRSEFEISLRHGHNLRKPFAGATPAWMVLVELAAAQTDGLTEALSAALEAAYERGEMADVVIATSEQQRQDLWRIRHNVTEANTREGMGLTHDIAVPTYQVPDFLRRAGDALAARYPDATPVVVGHLGDGNMHYIAMFSHAFWAAVQDKVGFQRELSHVLYDIAAALDGTFSAEHGIGSLHVDEMRIYKDPVEIALMQQIKALFDPDGMMNPGRVLPGTGTTAADGHATH
ncbi:FAD-binding oxidoreductase [Chitinasiproducens palmae]|uniref:D-lactate dehydrogenase (Cytochrome) n=1 Tax=Chitinasiproducens palmae TaxID=1770053 RepID=A0A1H2PU46_9BURK|nr:FAD-binding oxidoreductase [Chitinasiproducens palmae]SDV50706.1 D-lactate dehydrogenase (cytochrome) [Chitinasiproducens palmae]